MEDASQRPNRSPRRIAPHFESLIAAEGKITGYGAQRLGAFLFQKYGYRFSMETVIKVPKRNKVPEMRIRAKNNNRRPLYDYEDLSEFRQFQLDTKHVLDENSFPREVYSHILQHTLPLYEWNMIDVATRGRFTAYSHRLDSTFGFSFIVVVLLWLRGHNVQDPIRIRVDNGAEFCMGSERKEKEWNMMFVMLNARPDPIPRG